MIRHNSYVLPFFLQLLSILLHKYRKLRKIVRDLPQTQKANSFHSPNRGQTCPCLASSQAALRQRALLHLS